MIVFEGEDLELAEANPADYIANQNNREQTTSLRIKAASIWAYVIKDEYRYFKPQVVALRYHKGLQLIKEKISKKDNLAEIMVGVHLFNQLTKTSNALNVLAKNLEVSSILSELTLYAREISKYIIEEVDSIFFKM